MPEIGPEQISQVAHEAKAGDRPITIVAIGSSSTEGVGASNPGLSYPSQLERDLITRCLEKTGGNKRQAARLLQLSRTTLIDKLHRLKIGAPSAAAEPDAK